MKPHQLLITLFVFAAASLDLAVLNRVQSFPHWSAAAFLGLAFGQLALLAVFATLGFGKTFYRIAALMAGTLLFARAASSITRPSFGEWLCVLGIFAAGLVVALVFCRANKTRFIEVAGRATFGHGLSCWQFSIASVISLTVVVAILIRLIQSMQFPFEHAAEVSGYCLASILFAGAALSLVTKTRSWPIRIVSAAGSTSAALFLVLHSTNYATQFAVIGGVMMATIVSATWVVEIGGVRLMRVDQMLDGVQTAG